MKNVLNIWLFLTLVPALVMLVLDSQEKKGLERLLEQRIKQGDGYPAAPVPFEIKH